MAEVHENGAECAAPREATVDRQALALQRSREIYYRTGGRPPQPDYTPFTERHRQNSVSYLDRRAG